MVIIDTSLIKFEINHVPSSLTILFIADPVFGGPLTITSASNHILNIQDGSHNTYNLDLANINNLPDFPQISYLTRS